MAWEWSHTQEAYDYAKQRLLGTRTGVLQVIYAEWRISEAPRGGNPDDCTEGYIEQASRLEHDVLAHLVWEKASEQRICDTGGFNAWICPWGCHTVPFGPKEE